MHAPTRLHPTVRCDAPLPLARTLACPPPVGEEDQHAVRTSQLISRLVDALVATFSLSEYEEQVVHHVLFGRSCGAIAWRLGIRETAVHKHMHRILFKTRCDERRDLYDLSLRLAARAGIVGRSRMNPTSAYAACA
ncbi:hypothetical protein DB30_00286 [Enhygromyxa salina]|uniref:HTH luxR-type domain-containing protein n=1 Tax=Enhygromyxa salina TaxID=215803 RepID=A0A0C2D609_9BACT|nr:helix-turn-helix transcriptional regulator [Enhygromyxa salina]KIG18601.1 hypothetical protein DB30_00286 [Enhygromyxa salina]